MTDEMKRDIIRQVVLGRPIDDIAELSNIEKGEIYRIIDMNPSIYKDIEESYKEEGIL